MKMTVTWLRWWLAFFRCNPNYKAYCLARREGDDAARADLEAKYERIAELYEDWGDIHAPGQAGNDLESYFAWSKDRASTLFFRARVVTPVKDPSAYVKKEGHLLLDIPLSEKLAEVMEQVEKYLSLVYKMRTDVLEREQPVSKAVMELPVPKYMLHAPGGKLNVATEGSIKKAVYVDGFRHRRKDDGKPLSITDTVLAIKQDSTNPLGWKLTSDDKRDLQRGVFKKGLSRGSEVTLIKRHRKDFDAYVRNTIHGRFPDNS
jgi:hypothetical protein